MPAIAVAIAMNSQLLLPSGLAIPSAASMRHGMSPAYWIWRLISSRTCKLRSVIPIGAEAAEAGALGAITTTVAPLFSACSTSGFNESVSEFAAGELCSAPHAGRASSRKRQAAIRRCRIDMACSGSAGWRAASQAVVAPEPGDEALHADVQRRRGLEAVITPDGFDVGAGRDHVARLQWQVAPLRSAPDQALEQRDHIGQALWAVVADVVERMRHGERPHVAAPNHAQHAVDDVVDVGEVTPHVAGAV